MGENVPLKIFDPGGYRTYGYAYDKDGNRLNRRSAHTLYDRQILFVQVFVHGGGIFQAKACNAVLMLISPRLWFRIPQ